MTKTPRVLFDTGQSTKSIGTTNFRNSVQFVKFVLRVSRKATGTSPTDLGLG
jgi:hypothetical protein